MMSSMPLHLINYHEEFFSIQGEKYQGVVILENNLLFYANRIMYESCPVRMTTTPLLEQEWVKVPPVIRSVLTLRVNLSTGFCEQKTHVRTKNEIHDEIRSSHYEELDPLLHQQMITVVNTIVNGMFEESNKATSDNVYQQIGRSGLNVQGLKVSYDSRVDDEFVKTLITIGNQEEGRERVTLHQLLKRWI